MAKMERLEALLEKLKSRQGTVPQRMSVVVGYTQHYAIYVHENLEAHHEVGQAKFLEQPAREMAGQLHQMILRVMKKGGSFQQALLMAGLRIQRESQKLVPVDTGALKASAFTRIEEGGEDVEGGGGEGGE